MRPSRRVSHSLLLFGLLRDQVREGDGGTKRVDFSFPTVRPSAALFARTMIFFGTFNRGRRDTLFFVVSIEGERARRPLPVLLRKVQEGGRGKASVMPCEQRNIATTAAPPPPPLLARGKVG